MSGPLRGAPDRVIALDAADSGTAARFLAAAAAATPGRFLLGGSPRLCERPIGELVDALRSAGARIAYRARRAACRSTIEGGTLRFRGGGRRRVPARASFSRRFCSPGWPSTAACACAPAGAVVSWPYVATTLEVLRDFGHSASAGAVVAVRRARPRRRGSRRPATIPRPCRFAAAVCAAGGAVTL